MCDLSVPLGFRAISAFHSCNITYAIPSVLDGELLDDRDVMPGFIKSLRCMTTTPIPSECYIDFLGNAVPPINKQPSKVESYRHAVNVELKNVAWVSCKGTGNSTNLCLNSIKNGSMQLVWRSTIVPKCSIVWDV